MSNNENPEAFPFLKSFSFNNNVFNGDIAHGMTLRDWYAGQALQGMNASLTDYCDWPSEETIKRMAKKAYEMADAMLEARKEKS